MADENILTRLGKLFQNQIVVRKTDSWTSKSQRCRVFSNCINI